MKSLNLKELVERIRDELEHVDRERVIRGREPMFQLETLELELKFTVSEAVGGEGGVDLKIVTWGHEASVSTESIQTVRIQYKLAAGEQEPLPKGALAHPDSRPS